MLAKRVDSVRQRDDLDRFDAAAAARKFLGTDGPPPFTATT
jgi:hypothetical protein